MQGRGPAENSPRANTAATASGTTEARILKRNMTLLARQEPATSGLWLAERKQKSLPPGLCGGWYGSDSIFKQPRSSLRGAKRRSNPFFLSAVGWIASLRSQ